MTNQKPTLAVFDLDNTLYEYEPAHRAGEAAVQMLGIAETGLTAVEWAQHWSAGRETVKGRLGRTASSHSRLLYAAETLERIGFNHQPKLLLQLEQAYWRDFLLAARLRDGAEDLLVALRYNDVTITMVTDLTLQIQLRKLVHFRIDALIDHLVASEETPSDKWSGQSFDLMLERVGAEARRNVWFIGDGPDDAPVPQLVDSGRIESGRGFIFGPPQKEAHLTGWRDLRQVERALSESFKANG